MSVESSYDLRTLGFASIAGVPSGFTGSALKAAIFGSIGFAADDNTIISVDLINRVIVSTIVLTDGLRITSLEVSPDGTALIATGYPVGYNPSGSDAGWVHYISLSGGFMTHQNSFNVELVTMNGLVGSLCIADDGTAYVSDRAQGLLVVPPPYTAVTDTIPLPIQNDPLYSIFAGQPRITPSQQQLLVGLSGALAEEVDSRGSVVIIEAPFNSGSTISKLQLPVSAGRMAVSPDETVLALSSGGFFYFIEAPFSPSSVIHEITSAAGSSRLTFFEDGSGLLDTRGTDDPVIIREPPFDGSGQITEVGLPGTVCVTLMAPKRPLGVHSESPAVDGFTIFWQPPANTTVLGYEVDLATDNGFTDFIPGWSPNTFDGVTTSVVVEGLTTATNYWVRVRALTPSGLTVNSGAVQMPTLGFNQTVDGLVASDVEPENLTLTWNQPQQGAPDEYIVDVGLDAGFGSFLLEAHHTGSTLLTYEVTGMTTGDTYWFRVRGVTGGIEADNSNVVEVTMPPFGVLAMGLENNAYGTAKILSSRNLMQTPFKPVNGVTFRYPSLNSGHGVSGVYGFFAFNGSGFPSPWFLQSVNLATREVGTVNVFYPTAGYRPVSPLFFSQDGTVAVAITTENNSTFYARFFSHADGVLTATSLVTLSGWNTTFETGNLDAVTFDASGTAYIRRTKTSGQQSGLIHIIPSPYTTITDTIVVPLTAWVHPEYPTFVDHFHGMTISPDDNTIFLRRMSGDVVIVHGPFSNTSVVEVVTIPNPDQFSGMTVGVSPDSSTALASGNVKMWFISAPFSAASTVLEVAVSDFFGGESNPDNVYSLEPQKRFPGVEGFLMGTVLDANPSKQFFTRLEPPYTSSAVITVGTIARPVSGFVIE